MTKRVLVCRTLRDADAGGIPEDVSESALADALKALRLIDPNGAARIEDPEHPGLPQCPSAMPKSLRLLRVRHNDQWVGVVVRTYAGGGAAQRDGVISEASGNPADRSNLHRFFEGGTQG